jgi:GNAT superfamily N-acetyltransferase
VALVPIDVKYLGDLESIDEAAYGVTYDWWHPFERVTVMMYEQAKGFISYRITTYFVEIEKLVVREDLRRKGIGSEMLNWLIKRCRYHGIQDLQITIPESNLIGSQFLASRGFDSKLKGRVIHFTRRVVV